MDDYVQIIQGNLVAFNLTRMTIYALISAIEEDLRSLIKSYISEEKIITPEILSRAKGRIEKDIGVLFGGIELNELIDYFDLGDTFQTINSNKSLFPAHISKTIKEMTKNLELIIPVRNRVMHIRPLNFDDLQMVSEFCKKLVDLDRPEFR